MAERLFRVRTPSGSELGPVSIDAVSGLIASGRVMLDATAAELPSGPYLPITQFAVFARAFEARYGLGQAPRGSDSTPGATSDPAATPRAVEEATMRLDEPAPDTPRAYVEDLRRVATTLRIDEPRRDGPTVRIDEPRAAPRGDDRSPVVADAVEPRRGREPALRTPSVRPTPDTPVMSRAVSISVRPVPDALLDEAPTPAFEPPTPVHLDALDALDGPRSRAPSHPRGPLPLAALVDDLEATEHDPAHTPADPVAPVTTGDLERTPHAPSPARGPLFIDDAERTEHDPAGHAAALRSVGDAAIDDEHPATLRGASALEEHPATPGSGPTDDAAIDDEHPATLRGASALDELVATPGSGPTGAAIDDEHPATLRGAPALDE
ncbi:hypothetical protein L6R52_33115, partial [Myxococcota bacterium]|nr:hypothetical protein [Myxococcota bacterium]